MTRTLVSIAALLAVATVATPAAAQSSAAPTSPKSFIGGMGGVQAVENIAGLGGGHLGMHLTPRVDVIGEAVYLQDVATRRLIESATTVGSYLTQSQGRTTTTTITVPTWVVTGGLRYFMTDGTGPRMYVAGQGGFARSVLRPSFTLNGADITGSLSQYGVTLGSDLTGSTTKAAFGGGIGVLIVHRAWYFDPAVRIIVVELGNQRSNVMTVGVSVGRRF